SDRPSASGWPRRARRRARRRCAGRRRRRDQELARLKALDELHDVAVIAHVLNEEHLSARDDHRLLRALRFAAALDELRAGLFRRRKVEDVAEHEPVGPLLPQFAEVGRATLIGMTIASVIAAP